MTIQPKALYIFHATPNRLPMEFFHRTRTKIKKNMYGNIKDQITKAIWTNKNRAGRTSFLDSDTTTKLQ